MPIYWNRCSRSARRNATSRERPSPRLGLPPLDSLRFVIQKHSARGLHCDFRLELDGVYPIGVVPDRVARIGDLWNGILDAKKDLRIVLDIG